MIVFDYVNGFKMKMQIIRLAEESTIGISSELLLLIEKVSRWNGCISNQ